MPLTQPRLAELVATELRDRILSGRLRDGDLLPRQEDLLAEFDVSKPSLREALRILEGEGLLTVRRGNKGGSIVHLPQPGNAAYMIGLTLKFREVPFDDVAAAARHLEPVCASLCAERPDRATDVVPVLRELHAQFAEAVDDPVEFTRLSRRFHEEIVAGCGNETLMLLMGVLESLWDERWGTWAEKATTRESYPDRAQRLRGVTAHERLLRLIEAGEPEKVAQQMRRHLDSTLTYLEPLG